MERYCRHDEPVFLTLNNSSWKISKRLRLTVTQGHQLAKLAAKYKLRTGKPLPDFSDIIVDEVKVKAEGRKAFEEIRRILAAE